MSMQAAASPESPEQRNDASTSAAVELKGLGKQFGDHWASRDVDLTIGEGELFSIVGPSGCGKTTTLRLLAGLEQCSTGQIWVGGREVTRLPAYRRPVNTVFQHYALFPHLSVFENVAFGLRERKASKDEIQRRVRDALDLVQLTGRDSTRPNKLSGGQQQRVALARALVLEPAVLLFDEPLGALDLKLRREMQVALREMQHRVGRTFVYVTHDQEEAFSMSDRVAVMDNGRVAQVASPREIYERPESLYVARFVGASNAIEGTVREVRADGAYVLDLVGGDTVHCAGVSGLRTGARAALLARPEAAELPSDRDELRMRGIIRDVAFLGPQTNYLLECGEIGAISVQASGAGLPGAPVAGDEIEVAWPLSRLWAMARE